MNLAGRNRGDRVRLPDGRVIELAWPMWDYGTKKKDQAKLPPTAWFAREIVDDFGGERRVDLRRMLVAETEIVEVVREFKVGRVDADDGAGQQGPSYDPVLHRTLKNRGTPQGGLL